MICPTCHSPFTRHLHSVTNGSRKALIFECINPTHKLDAQKINLESRKAFQGPKSQVPTIRDNTFCVLKDGGRVLACPTKDSNLKPTHSGPQLWGYLLPPKLFTKEHYIHQNNGKGDKPRPVNREKFTKGYDKAFGPNTTRQSFKPKPKGSTRP